MALHRILGAGAPPWSQTVNDDGDPGITTATLFYLTTVTGWTCVGGRVHVPNDVRVNGVALTLSAWATPGTPADLAVAPDRTWSGTAPAAGGWVEADWAPLAMEPGTWVTIGVTFDGAPDCYLFTGAGEVGAGFVQAGDGSTLYLAETGAEGGRGRFRIGAGGTGSSSAWYGLDITVDDGEGTAVSSGVAPWSFGAEATTARESAAGGTTPWEFGAEATTARESSASGTAPWEFGAVATTGGTSSSSGVAPWSFGAIATTRRPSLGSTPTITILETLRAILDTLTFSGSPGESPGQSDCLLVPQPCRVVLSPGLDIAWDSCGDHACADGGRDGQLWANITTMTIVNSSAGSCERINWTADVGIVRCAATLQEDGSAPPVAAEEHDAWQQAADADRIRYAIRCCEGRSELVQDLSFVSWTALGPSGGCVGGAWTISGALEDCCGAVPDFPRGPGC